MHTTHTPLDDTPIDHGSIDPSTAAHDALEVRVLWGSELLQVTHLSPPRPFVISDDADADFALPGHVLGHARLELPPVNDTRIAGGLTFHTRLCEQAERVGSAPPTLQGFAREHAWLLGSLACHALLLTLFALMPPSASAISIGDLRSDQRYVSALLLADSREDEPPEVMLDKPDRGQEGKAHEGAEGAMGDREAPKRKARAGVQGKPDEPDPVLARERALHEAQTGGILGVLRAAAAQDVPTSIYGEDLARGRDPQNALAALLGPQIASAHGFGGLGMFGTGRGAGGDGKGTLGIGDLATIGRNGTGDSGGIGGALSMRTDRKAKVPTVTRRPPVVMGGLSKEIIRRYVHRQLPQVRHCYEQTLRERPDLEGRVAVRFMIDQSGVVRAAVATDSSLGHARTERCIADAVGRITFPQPEGGGMVKVTYPFVLSRP